MKNGKSDNKPINKVLIDKDKPQFFDFDKTLLVDDKIVEKKNAVELWRDGAERAFKAETSYLFAHTIRISCSKTDKFEVGERVLLKVMDEEKESQSFLELPCEIDNVEHFSKITHLVLKIEQSLEEKLGEYQKWFDSLSKTSRSEEVDHKAVNFILQYYKRTLVGHLLYPVLFTGQQIRHAFVSKPGAASLSFEDEKGGHLLISADMFYGCINLPKKSDRIPLYLWSENNKVYFFSGQDYPKLSPKKIIPWLISKPDWRVLLLCNRKAAPIHDNQLAEIETYVESETIQDAEKFKNSFAQIDSVTSVLDISCLFEHVWQPLEEKIEISAKQAVTVKGVAEYQVPSFRIKRSEPRYQYAMKLKIGNMNGGGEIEVITRDVSFLGMSATAVGESLPFTEQAMVSVEFLEWNANLKQGFFKREEPFADVEYKVVNLYKSQDGWDIRLKRDKRDTDPKINALLNEKLDEVKQSDKGEIRNNLDLYKSLYSGLWIANNIAGLAFFIGKDQEGVRIIQAIVQTEENAKVRAPFKRADDWRFLQQLALPVAVELNKNTPGMEPEPLNIGIYVYLESSGGDPQWRVKTDLDFNSIEAKASFVKQALEYSQHYFFHAVVLPVKGGKDDILNGESSAMVSFAALRLKQIHCVCNSLIAVAELTNVTKLVEFVYRS